MKPTIQVTGLLDEAECELTKRRGECVLVRIGDEPEMKLLGSELLKFIRFEQLKATKKNAGRSAKSGSS